MEVESRSNPGESTPSHRRSSRSVTGGAEGGAGVELDESEVPIAELSDAKAKPLIPPELTELALAWLRWSWIGEPKPARG